MRMISLPRHEVFARATRWVAPLALLLLTWTRSASAFCGFFVTGANTSLYANATMVVLMRDGTRTVLSMQNNYQGPPDQFALVIPVPVILQQEQVKTLPADVFGRVDQMGAPRLVEYWETDPCRSQVFPPNATGAGGSFADAAARASDASGSVRIEAQFTVGEYNIVILSADDSSALATWLTDNQYNIPPGADPVLAPYVAAGMKFFVAKVDPARVTFVSGQAALSPLRFYYDSTDFSLPVRLGLLNSNGQQDLIVNILAPNRRYEVANYTNTTIPTNIRVRNEVRNDFGSFYEALFQRAIAGHARTVVTEYSWDAQSCDPCPIPPLSANDLATLGADVTRGASGDGGGFVSSYLGYTLTRLHYRYSSSELGDDLVFREAPTLQGGRGIPDRNGNLDPTVQTGLGANNFQGRYVILHPWTEPLLCDHPERGFWGGPPGAPGQLMTQATTNGALKGAAPTPGPLESLVAQDVTSIGVSATNPVDPLVGEGDAGTAPVDAGRPNTEAGGPGVDDAGSPNTEAGVDGRTARPDASSGGGLPDASLGKPAETHGPRGSGCGCGVARPSGWPLFSAFATACGIALARRRRRNGTASGRSMDRRAQ